MRRNVACVTDRQDVIVRAFAQSLKDFESNGFLSLQAIRIDRIDDIERQGSSHFLHEAHAIIEVATYLDDHRSMHHRLG